MLSYSYIKHYSLEHLVFGVWVKWSLPKLTRDLDRLSELEVLYNN